MSEKLDESYNTVEKAELEKEQCLLGSSLLSAINFVPFKSDDLIYHVPKIVHETTTWLLTRDLSSIKLMNSSKFDTQIEQILKKYQKGSQDTNILSSNERPQVVWSVLKTYINALPHYIVSRNLITQIYYGVDIKSVIRNLPQEDISLISQLLLLVDKMLCLGSEEFSSLGVDKFFSSLIFSYDPSEYDFVNSIFKHMCLKIKSLLKCCNDPATPSLNYNEILLKRFYRVCVSNIGITNLWLTDCRIIVYFLNFNNDFTLPISSINFIKIPKRKKREVIIIDKLEFKYCFKFDSVLMAHFFFTQVLSLLSSRSLSGILKFTLIDAYSHIPDSWGWNLYLPKDEFKRLNLINRSSKWVLSKFNISYEINTYPSLILLLKSSVHRDFRNITGHYLRNRIPIPVWHSSKLSSLLLRSDVPNLHSVGSQDPKTFNKPTVDMKYLDAVFSEYKNKYIISTSEFTTYYYSSISTEWNFCYFSLPDNDTLQKYYGEMSITSYQISKFQKFSNTDSSCWYRTVSQVLNASEKLAGTLKHNSCVLLLHSPNYDIDFVISSIAQILHDDFYRTIRGFATLIEKDWCSYGFDFARKLAEAGVSPDYHDKKPILEMFFECVWQLLVKYYTQFEFTGSFLFDTLCEAYALRFGTFMANNYKERELLSTKTVSYWTYVADVLNDDKYHWLNPLFIQQPLILHVPSQSNIRYWHQLHWTFEERIRELNFNKCFSQRQIPTGQPLLLKLKNYNSCDILMNISNSGAFIVSLDISLNRITHIPTTVFQLGHLQKLTLSHNSIGNLKSIHMVLFQTFFPNLKILELSDTKMTRFVKNLSYLSCLDVLRASHNSFSQLGPVSALTNLQLLEIDDNMLVAIDDCICNLSQLKSLVANENRISQISDNLSKLSSLSNLNLQSNALESFADGILGLESLRMLNLQNNSITEFPKEHKLSNLLALNLSQNKISKMFNVSNYHALKKLYLANNSIERIDAPLPSSLEELNLSHNTLKYISPFILDLAELRVLNLSWNNLKKLHSEMPYKLSKLEVLSASCNYLTLDNMPAIGLMSNLRDLNLKKNQYIYIPPTLSCLAGRGKKFKLDWNEPAFSPSDSSYESNMEELKSRLSDDYKVMYSKIEFLTDKTADSLSVLKSIASFRDGAGNIDQGYFNTYVVELPKSVLSKYTQSRPSVRLVFFKNFDGYQDSLMFDEGRTYQPKLHLIIWKLGSAREKFRHCLNTIKHKTSKIPIVVVLHGSTEIYKDSANITTELNNTDPLQIQSVFYTSNKDVKNVWKVLEDVVFKSQPSSISYKFLMLELFFRSEWQAMPISITFSQLEKIASDCHITDTLKAAKYLAYNGVIAFSNFKTSNDRLIVSRSHLNTFLTLLLSNKSPFNQFGIFPLNSFLSSLVDKWDYEDIKCSIDWLCSTFSIFLFNPSLEIVEKAETIFGIENRMTESRMYNKVLPVNEQTSHVNDNFNPKSTMQSRGSKLMSGSYKDLHFEDLAYNQQPTIQNQQPPLSESIIAENYKKLRFFLDKFVFIPWKLSDAVPFNKPLFWPKKLPDACIQFGRYYNFDVFPDSLYYGLLSRTFNIMLFKCLWRTGAIFEDSLTKEIVYVALQNRVIKIKVRGYRLFKLATYVFEIMDAMRRTTKIFCRVKVPCPHCVRTSNAARSHKTVFSLEECVRAEACNRPYVYCNAVWPVMTQAVIPDLSFFNIPELLVPAYELIYEGVIGEGGSAKVYAGWYRNQKIAIKKLRVDLLAIEDEQGADIMVSTVGDAYLNFTFEMCREVHFMHSFRHECLVGILGLVIEQLCFIEDLCDGGSLYDYLYDPNSTLAKLHPISWPLRLKIALDVAEGLSVLHNNDPRIVHKDLKSPNILLIQPRKNYDSWSKQPVVARVSDFGISGWVPTVVGRQVDNPTWLAPEVMRGDLCDYKCDVYSFGVILYELLTGMQYFKRYEFMIDVENAVLSGERPEIDPNDVELNKIGEYLDLMKSCWAADPYERPSFSNIILMLKYIISNYENGNVAYPPSSVQCTKEYLKIEDSMIANNFIYDIVKPKFESVLFQDDVLCVHVHENIVLCGFTYGFALMDFGFRGDGIVASLLELRDLDPSDAMKVKIVFVSLRMPTPKKVRFDCTNYPIEPSSPNTCSDEFEEVSCKILMTHEKLVSRSFPLSKNIEGVNGIRVMGRFLCICDMSHCVNVYELEDHEISLISSEYIEDIIMCLDTVDEYIVIITKNGTLRWFDLQQLKWKEKKFNLGTFYCMLVIDSELLTWVGSDKKVFKFDYAFKHVGSISNIQYSITCMALHKSTVWSGSQESVLQVWDVATGALITSMMACQDEILDLAVLNDTVFSSSKNKSIIIWDANHHSVLSIINGSHLDMTAAIKLEAFNNEEVWIYSSNKVVKRCTISPNTSPIQQKKDK